MDKRSKRGEKRENTKVDDGEEGKGGGRKREESVREKQVIKEMNS